MARHVLCPLALVLGLIALLAGCALPWQQAKGPQPLPDAQQIYRPLDAGPTAGDLDALDPALIRFSSDNNLAQLIFPPLVTLDDHNQAAPWASDRWETSADGLTWTFHIHPDMQWSDGVPIDASTYAYSINRSLDPCTRSPVGYYLSGTGPELIAGSVAFNGGTCPTDTSTDTLVGTSIVRVDPLTLKITLSHPAAYFPVVLSYPAAWAQPRQLIERYGPVIGRANLGWTDHLEGFGGNLFTVKTWDHAGHFDLVRNEAFWGPKPRLHEIDVTLYHDVDTVWANYKAGRGDSMSSPPPAALAHAKALPGFHADPGTTITYLAPHWRLAPYNDVRVRQALDLAIDRHAIAQVSHGMLTPSMHMVPQGVPGYDPDLRDPAGRTGDAALGPDIAKARALWQSYLDENFGGHAEQAPPVVFAYVSDNALGGAISLLLLQGWRAALPGVQVRINIRDRARVGIDDFVPPVVLTGWAMDYPDPQDFLSLLVHTNSAYNQTSIDLPKADQLMDQADANPDQVERLRQYQQAEQLYVSAVAWIPLCQSLYIYLARPTVVGYHERAAGSAALAVWQWVYVTTQAT